MKKLLLLCTVALAAISACKNDSAPTTATPAKPSIAEPTDGPFMSKVAQGQELFATINTNLGTVVVKLYSKDAPVTVKNFVGLATGEKQWKNPATGEIVKNRALYDGVVFHRVIPDFMIQGGDPLGTGTGDPGYRFADEFQSGKTFDRVGLLAMANAGPGTNGSQFFITTSTPQHLNNHHTIFGEVVQGYDVVTAISKVPTGGANRPLQPVTISHIAISDHP